MTLVPNRLQQSSGNNSYFLNELSIALTFYKLGLFFFEWISYLSHRGYFAT